MKTTRLNRNEIQVLDLGKLCLVYAPLAGVAFKAFPSDVERMETALGLPKEALDETAANVLAQLTRRTVTEYQSRIIHHPSEYTTLSLLPNLKCNFHCTYCYSAKGRSTEEIPQEKLRAMLDWFIDAQRVPGKELNLFISGGGEPLLSLDRLRFLFEYSKERARRQGLALHYAINTNGSLVTPEIVDLFLSHQVSVGVSFDILPEVQNAQRGQYEKVAENIRRMVSRGLVPGISTVITGNNVHRMTEMVEEIVKKFPGIRHLNFDPAMDDEAFSTVAQLDTFFQDFEDHFFQAKWLALQHHLTLDCDLIRHAQKLFARYCQGQLCLVPNGDISICHTVSSPEEKGYADMVYGKVENGQVVFDEAKFADLVNRDHFMREECEPCIAKWHCSGGCRMFRRNYDSGKMQAVCRFTKHMTARILLGRLEQRNHRKRQSIRQLHKLTILPTHRCNFHCSYCFSAQGRQNKTLGERQALAAIDFFINRERTDLKTLWLAILGGGEPFLTPELTLKIIERACRRAKEQGFQLGIGLTTNGSVYHPELSKAIVENHVSLGVSFEVLKDIQNEQRQHYDEVVPVVRHYLDDGADLTVKSIITPNNVQRLEEMVEELHRLFPQVKQYKLQIVEDPVAFSNREAMRRFYADFTEHFFPAREKGRQFGIDVHTLASLNADEDKEHYCGGEMCLNPEGTLTVCHRFSSPAEQPYHDMVYGAIDSEGHVRLDEERFAELMGHDITQLRCFDCSARTHCGGGCLAQSKIYQPDQLDIICDWTRSFIKEIYARRRN